jgi:hypothetical protein
MSQTGQFVPLRNRNGVSLGISRGFRGIAWDKNALIQSGLVLRSPADPFLRTDRNPIAFQIAV